MLFANFALLEEKMVSPAPRFLSFAIPILLAGALPMVTRAQPPASRAYTPAQIEFTQAVKPTVLAVRGAFRDRDARALARLLPPAEPLLFRYLGSRVTRLSAAELGQMFARPRVRYWGRADGSGKPIRGTFKDLWWPRIRRRLLSYDLVGVDEFVMSGNAPDRGLPGARFLDFSSVGSKQYGYLDWESVRLFFVARGSRWYLKAIDLSHWTI
ncbi:MAG: hypothetical protein HY320_07645 [Armatimonadetes bacterium]|nr:hypothetical protein [Armatimonadota bacterium]